jgi:Protein of unknown function (DUF3011)
MTSLSRQFTGSAIATSLALAGVAVPTAAARAAEKYEITCQPSGYGSNGYGEQFCAAPNRKVKLVDDFSGRCDKGNTWRYDDRGVYVRNGCAGRFRITRDDYADGGYGNGDYGNDGSGTYRKKDNTGTVVAAVALGAGLLWLISQSGKNKKNPSSDTSSNGGSNSDGTNTGDWTNPDGNRDRTDPLRTLSTSERRAVDVCTREVDRDVRAKGGRDITLQELIAVAPGGLTDRYYVTARYAAMFDSKTITRKVECDITANRVTGYKLS